MDLFDWFNTISIDEIHQLVADGREEDLHLDFKLVNDPDLKNRDDRRNFAKAVSGFANSDGGLIVWGVDCRKNDDDIDCARDAPGIDSLQKFYSRLMEFTASAANPSVSGVEHRSLPDSNGADHGFAVTYVPASDGGPHMAKLGEDRYYKRSGASFLKMEHFEIADMFGRRPHPKLTLNYKKFGPSRFGATPSGPKFRFKFHLILENHGRGSARAPYLAFRSRDPLAWDAFGVDGNRHHGLPRLPSSDDFYRFGGSGDVFLNPGAALAVTAVTAEIEAAKPAAAAAIEYEIGAADLPLEKGTLVIPDSEL
ncbi:ATP-binding protein [bacterium]|nr:ATP-binding protein [bacterium]